MGLRAAVIWWHYIKLSMEFTMLACTGAETLGMHMKQLLACGHTSYLLHTIMRTSTLFCLQWTTSALRRLGAGLAACMGVSAGMAWLG
jgi:hypothetical protein